MSTRKNGAAWIAVHDQTGSAWEFTTPAAARRFARRAVAMSGAGISAITRTGKFLGGGFVPPVTVTY